MTLAPVHLTGPAAMRAGWRLLRDPITAMRQNHAEYGPLIVISDLLPFARGVKLATLGLPASVDALSRLRRGLVLVGGPTGAGQRILAPVSVSRCAGRRITLRRSAYLGAPVGVAQL